MNQLVQGQIPVGCFQSQPDSSTELDGIKSYQDIFMSHGACTNFCKSNGAVYAITLEGSTCRCSNAPPLTSNKVDDSKCNKPCTGYPPEKCGGTSSQALATVLLIGSSIGIPVVPPTVSDAGNPPKDTNEGNKDNNKNNKNNNGNNMSNNGSNSGVIDGGKSLSTNSPDDAGSRSSGPSAGAIAASIMAILGFGALFAFAVVFSRRRRQRRAQAAWTENMFLPSSLVHCSNDGKHRDLDYVRSSPINHSNNVSQQGYFPSNSVNLHYPPPPALHPRQGGPMHIQQPSYPPPMMGTRYNNMCAPYQPFPLPPLLTRQQTAFEQQQHADLNYKESVLASPTCTTFSRGPQSLQQPTFPDIQDLEYDHEHDQNRQERILSHPSVRTLRAARRGNSQREREPMETYTSRVRRANSDGSYYKSDS
ncbi:hypothetical protein BG011_000738 [Mortierella polycephala]|uniref:WSC domain-containing protein n=1 Tax=Mortierella polycephala TaxID=41804 RepID=A0A9P6U6F7_9FUNG|nr:hypothetical protein BG011_000738 [Mortierella polycephala]